MLNKMVLFVILAIAPAYAASPEQPNSPPQAKIWLPWPVEKANQGDVNSQYRLGFMNYYGPIFGNTQDCNEALNWLTKAAEQGHASAQSLLGSMYAKGECVQQDYKEAAKWYTKSAKLGCGSAQQSLGEMYYDGEGVPQDYSEALKWLLMSVQTIKAEQKKAKESEKRLGYQPIAEMAEPFLLRDSYFYVGIIYYYGQGTPVDYNEAFQWYKKAADCGITRAQFYLGKMYYNGMGVPQDEKEAVKWHTMAAANGDADAQNDLGVAYELGTGVSKDYKEGVKWYRKSAEHGNARAQRNLARMYFEGKGVIEDYVEAYKWSLIAGMNGEDVTIIKQNCYNKMTYSQISEAQSLAKEFVAKKEISSDRDALGIEKRTSPKSSGTGFFISPSGYIITAAHVVKESRSVKVFSSAGQFQAKVVLIDEPTDTAILKVDGTEFPYLEMVSSSTVGVGNKIFTMGFPNVSVQGIEPKYTNGTISSLSGVDDNIRHFQISIPIQPGNSGGPLLSEKGEVVGVIVSRLDDIGMLEATGTLPQNVNYAVKSAFILPLLENLSGWQTLTSKSHDETMRNTEIINKARNAIVLILVY